MLSQVDRNCKEFLPDTFTFIPRTLGAVCPISLSITTSAYPSQHLSISVASKDPSQNLSHLCQQCLIISASLHQCRQQEPISEPVLSVSPVPTHLSTYPSVLPAPIHLNTYLLVSTAPNHINVYPHTYPSVSPTPTHLSISLSISPAHTNYLTNLPISAPIISVTSTYPPQHLSVSPTHIN